VFLTLCKLFVFRFTQAQFGAIHFPVKLNGFIDSFSGTEKFFTALIAGDSHFVAITERSANFF